MIAIDQGDHSLVLTKSGFRQDYYYHCPDSHKFVGICYYTLTLGQAWKLFRKMKGRRKLHWV
jgi:hypothetical protein